MWLATAALSVALASTQVGDDHLDRAWGPLVPTMSTRPAVTGWTTARYGTARHLFNGTRASWGGTPGRRTGVWVTAEVVSLVWWVPVEARSGVQLDHASWGWGGAVRSDPSLGWHVGAGVEVGVQAGSNVAGVVRTAAVERVPGPFVAHYVWLGHDRVTILGGAGTMSAWAIGVWGSAAVAVDLHDRLAVQASTRATYERRSRAIGLAWTGRGGWSASATAMVNGAVSFGEYTQTGPWMPHVELAWRLRPAEG